MRRRWRAFGFPDCPVQPLEKLTGRGSIVFIAGATRGILGDGQLEAWRLGQADVVAYLRSHRQAWV
jgi:hypothetical protein